MWFGVITLFPEMFNTLSAGGIAARAKTKKLIDWAFINPRDFTFDMHRTVDDRPYGGGPGMILKPEPLNYAVRVAKLRAPEPPKVICLSPGGKPLNQKVVTELSKLPSIVLIAGRYEGIDQRFLDQEVDQEISIGDYVLSGGELPAMVLMDAIIRLLPGALSHPDSAKLDSFGGESALLNWPQYTRPESFMGQKVPEVLLSGDHQAIQKWRQEQAKVRTKKHRPDLLQENS